MPTLTNFAIKTLLEPTSSIVPPLSGEPNPNPPDEPISESGRKAPASGVYIKSPALYTTPESKPIPPGASALSVTPSPYVFNRKRRDVLSSAPEASLNNRVDGFEIHGSDGEIDGVELSVKLPEEEEKEGEGGDGGFEEAFDFEASSVASSCEVDVFAKQTVMSPKSVVFFDADEEFFSDGSISNRSSSHISNVESELRTTRLALLEEVERRKAAEDAVNRLCSQWQRIGRKLYESGLPFPTPLAAGDSSEFQDESVEQLIQELVVTRFVYEAIVTDQARTEAEVAAAAIIDSKNQEISRLRDRLQYYETANQEMSHRNLEVVEIARRQREKRRQQKWLWGCLGMSVAVGASIIAYSYFPRASADLLAPSCDSDASTTSSSDSA